MHFARARSLMLGAATALAATACSTETTAPGAAARQDASASTISVSRRPEAPPFNFDAILRAPAEQDGFGLVKFRQPKNDGQIVYLNVSVRDLAPNTEYLLQRATDTIVDGDCTGTNWLTLGKGTAPQPITTDRRGNGRAALFRNLSAFPAGSTFDIHFRVIDAATSAVVLMSGCHHFTIR